MKTKAAIVENWLPRYTGEKLENFGEYILLTNFSNYVAMFAKWNKVKSCRHRQAHAMCYRR